VEDSSRVGAAAVGIVDGDEKYAALLGGLRDLAVHGTWRRGHREPGLVEVAGGERPSNDGGSGAGDLVPDVRGDHGDACARFQQGG
jgi:hypothetical protein